MWNFASRCQIVNVYWLTRDIHSNLTVPILWSKERCLKLYPHQASRDSQASSGIGSFSVLTHGLMLQNGSGTDFGASKCIPMGPCRCHFCWRCRLKLGVFIVMYQTQYPAEINSWRYHRICINPIQSNKLGDNTHFFFSMEQELNEHMKTVENTVRNHLLCRTIHTH